MAHAPSAPSRPLKRFWREVGVVERSVLLDTRPVLTPARAVLQLPNDALAEAIADEWRAVGDATDPRAMPLTGFANAAIDRVAPDPQRFVADLAHYGETDVLCYRADTPPDLVARQASVWDPLLDWARARYDIAFVVTPGIVHQAQPAETRAQLTAALTARDAFALAALSPIVTIGGSLVIALMLAEAAIEPDAAFDAAHLDELWQAERWGEEWSAADARAARRSDFAAAARFLTLL